MFTFPLNDACASDLYEPDELRRRYGFSTGVDKVPKDFRVPNPPFVPCCSAPPSTLVAGVEPDYLRVGYARYLASRKQEVTQTLSRYVTRWEAITSSEEVLNVIRRGHEIPFETEPPPFSGILDSSPSDPQGALVLRRELEDMLSKGAVTRVTGPEKHDGYSAPPNKKALIC